MTQSLAIPSPVRGAWLAELRATFALSVPLVLTNLAQIGLTTTDIAMMGWIGPDVLAAGALGANVFFLVFVFGLGTTVATAPVLAQEIGRCRHSVRDVRRTVRQGLWLAAALSVPMWLILWQTEAILLGIGQEPALAAMAGAYVRVMQWGLLPFFAFSVLRSFISALERPMAGLVITVLAIVINGFSNWLLMFGNFGFPELGIVGAGVSSALANLFMFAALAGYILTDRQFRRYHLFGRFWRADWERFFGLLGIGTPIAAAMLFEVSVFNVTALIAGTLGQHVLAAHAIAIQTAAISFMVPMGIAQAATVRVGLAAGRQDPRGVARAGWTGFGMGMSFMALAAIGMVTMPHMIVGLYLGTSLDAQPDVVEMAVVFLTIAAIFQLADGAQALGAGMLRGLADTRWPMIFAGIGYWGVGLPLGALLCFALDMGGTGLWIGLASGLAVVAAAMVTRWLLRERLGLIRAG
jgi:MATE family multidrug resistance protein